MTGFSKRSGSVKFWIHNPFYLFGYALIFAFIGIQFTWSSFFRAPSFQSIIIILAIIFVVFGLGILFAMLSQKVITKSVIRNVAVKDRCALFLFYILSSLEFLYSGVPIFEGGRYMEFGIPLLHVFNYGLAFYIMAFSVLLVSLSGSRQVSRFAYVSIISVVIFALLILSRHLIVMCVLYATLVYISVQRLSFSSVLMLLIVGFLFVYGFGVLGSIRVSLLLDIPYEDAENYILSAGGASDTFRATGLPVSFFWGWLYLCSPLYNFIYNVDNIELLGRSGIGIGDFLISEVIPETFSKRIFENFDLTQYKALLVVDWLTVGTAFSGPYYHLGLGGVFLLLGVLSILTTATHLLIRVKFNRLCFTFFASTVFSLLVFDNLLPMPPFIVAVILFILRPRE